MAADLLPAPVVEATPPDGTIDTSESESSRTRNEETSKISAMQ